MDELIAKLEALTGPRFAVEQEIYQAVYPEAWQKRIDDLLAGPMGPRLSPVDYSGYIKVPAYTASIDAAMTHAKGKSVRLLITEDGIGSALVDGTEGTAFNAATAIIIASLKAQEASNATSP